MFWADGRRFVFSLDCAFTVMLQLGSGLANPLENLSIQALFDAAADAMLLADADGRVLCANPAALELLGYASGEIEGLEVEQLIPEQYRAQHRASRLTYAESPAKRSMGKGKNLAALTRFGKELSVDIGLSPIESDGRHLVLLTLTPADRRRRAEDELRASEERMRLAKRAAGLGIFDFDARYNVIQCDSRMRQIWGLLPDEVMTYERFLAGIHPADRPARQAAINQATDPEGDGEYRVEYRVRSPVDNAERWVLAVGKVLFDDGHAERLVGIVQDITENKLLEQQLQAQRSDMESLSHQHVAIQTASAIAHELNQPLAAISAYSEVAMHSLENGAMDAEKLRRALEGCVAQAQRAGRSLHELIAYLQKGDIESEPVDLNHVVRESLAIAQKDGYGGFHPILQLEHALPCVQANRTQVQKVLVNLLRNGVEAMRGAGVPAAEITITVRTRADLNMVQVTVQDSGPGLNEEVTRRVFEPFFTTKPKGIGMGLAVSRALIEANGGQLWLDPEAGPGAVFHFTLPVAA